jgi:hypothetical protein
MGGADGLDIGDAVALAGVVVVEVAVDHGADAVFDEELVQGVFLF